MSFAINILALLLVLGLCWIAMVWLSMFHGHGVIDDVDRDLGDHAGPRDSDCQACEGIGAHSQLGAVIPCETCQGTGILT